MSDTTLNRILCYGTHAERLAFTPSQPSLSGTGPGDYINVIWTESDTGGHLTYAWNQAGSAWVQIASGSTGSTTRSVTFALDGGGSALTTSFAADVYVPYAATITAVTLLADQSGSVVVGISKTTYASFPGSLTSIVASAAPTLSSAQKSQDTTLTGWTTSISAGDVLHFSVTSAATITRLNCTLTVTV